MNEIDPKKKIIVLADDDSDDCMIFEEALNELNVDIELTIAKDGQDLMETLVDTAHPFPDIIFLDLNMPRKSGTECLREIRTNNRLNSIPIIIFSTTQNTEIINEMYKLGANHYVCKPSNFSILKEILKTVISICPKKLQKQPAKEDFLLSLV